MLVHEELAGEVRKPHEKPISVVSRESMRRKLLSIFNSSEGSKERYRARSLHHHHHHHHHHELNSWRGFSVIDLVYIFFHILVAPTSYRLYVTSTATS